MLDLWGEADTAHVALRDETANAIAVASLACPERRFPTLSAVRPAAGRLERAVRDLFGLDAADAIDKSSRAVRVGAEQLQLYRTAANLAGVSTGQLDSALGGFVKRVGELRAGTGSAGAPRSLP